MSAENNSRDRASMWVILPFVVAVVGTVVMLFTNSANALKIALIFALWAGAAGLIVNARVRREREAAAKEVAAAEERARELKQRHAEELAELEARPAAPSVDVEMLRELQEEIQALRNQLEELSGRVFEYEPAAVRASARRISEIEAVREPEPEPEPEPAGPSNDDTIRITKIRPSGAPSSDAIAGRIGAQPSRPARNPLSDLISERSGQHEAPEPEPAPEPEQPRSGRRRRDERGEAGLSVAELLARQNKER